MDKRIYLDYAATTPMDPAVLEAMRPYWTERFGNASSPHAFGQEAAAAVEEARSRIAGLLGAASGEIVFTSGGTESNNLAVIGTARALRSKGRHVICSSIEHHSVEGPVRYLTREGFSATRIPVDKQGIVDLQALRDAIRGETVLVSVMHASNEIGTVQPVAEIGRIAREACVRFHCDAVQTAGHIPVNVGEMRVDLLSLAAHKFYGPKGTGALYIRKGTPVEPVLTGGTQEGGRRASTHNTAGIVGMARALELCLASLSEEMRTQGRLRNTLMEKILHALPDVRINGHRDLRLPNNVNVSFRGIEGESLVMALDMEGIAVSTASACTAGATEPSHVLRAIGLSDETALSTLRLTLGRWTTDEDIEYCAERLAGAVKRFRTMSGLVT